MELFTNTNCSKCALLKTWLKSENIEYTERNISEEPEALQELLKNGRRSLPQVKINDEFVEC